MIVAVGAAEQGVTIEEDRASGLVFAVGNGGISETAE